MSWLTGLAGKAEHLLNNIDQAAGQALSEENKQLLSTQQSQQSQLSSATVNAKDSSYTPYLSQKSTSQSRYNKSQVPPSPSSSSISSSASVPSNLNQMDGDNNTGMSQMSSSMYAPSSSTPVAKTASNKRDKDEDLFAFLNNPDADSGTKKKTAVKTIVNGKHSRQSSTSSTQSSKSAKQAESVPNIETAITITPSDRSDQTEGTDQSIMDPQDDLLGNDSSSGYHSNQEDGGTQQQQLSALELENRLLKNEVASLNQEMTTVIQRTKSATEELTAVRRKLDHQQKQLASSDQVVRELRSRETDLGESLGAKDSQLAILRVRLEEADRELDEKKKTLGHLEEDRNRILQDHTSASDVQGQALDTLKDKLREAQLECKREKEAYTKLQQEYSERQATLESSQHELGEALAAAQKALGDEKKRHTELTAQAASARQGVQTARRELQDYKDKATRILQSKDKLIASLKDGASPTSGVGESAVIASAELEEVRGERALVKEELTQAQAALETLRAELSELETQAQQDSQAAQEELEALEAQLASEKTRRDESEHEAGSCRQELRYVNEELLKQKTAFQSRLKDRDSEIERLRNQLTTKSLSNNSQTELENRLHALTESLIQKQTMLEALGTEKSSLVLQLERMEKQYRELETNAIRSSATTVNMSENDDVRHRLPNFLRESPADGDVTRRVKWAASSIDKFSIRLGVFLRRYPIARVMVIAYMVLLHVWVLIVLMTYQPEIHGPDHVAPQPPE